MERRDTARLVRSERSAERRDADRLVRTAVDRRDTAKLVRSERSAERRDADRLVRSAMERRYTARLVRSERSADRRDANRPVRPVLASESYVKYKTENFEIDHFVEFFLDTKNGRVEMKPFGFVDEEATIVPMFSVAAVTLNSTENVISGEREEKIDSQRESSLLKKNDGFNFSMLNTDTLFSQVQVAHGYISEILLTVLGLRILESFAPWCLQGHNENDFLEQKSSGRPEVQISGLEEKQHKRSDGDFLTAALTGSAAAVALLISDHVKQR
ncbi:hypothetical protein R5R35_013881 [Gryllus longicercus]|uniref:Uncharacterized protein n=1 Tax=Gryllus longicercus TaxID=2509291 RepID=A0AAN9Z4Y2_9ORTH